MNSHFEYMTRFNVQKKLTLSKISLILNNSVFFYNKGKI